MCGECVGIMCCLAWLVEIQVTEGQPELVGCSLLHGLD